MARKTKPAAGMLPNHTLAVEQTPDETGSQAMARKMLNPEVRNALTASAFAGKAFGGNFEGPGIMDFVGHVQSATAKAEGGDLALASRMLASQAITLDSMFTELARRSAVNLGGYVGAAETYGRLALKAQGNCRATLEALARLHQPREQTVRHVHVNDGGQAIVADHFHHHRGGIENADSVKQSDATGAAGSVATLPRNDAAGQAVPVPNGERQAALSDARRHQSGRT